MVATPLREFSLTLYTLDRDAATEGNCMARLNRKLTLALFILIQITVLSGCIASVIRPETIEQDWLDKTEKIHPGETDRNLVRDILGEPFASSYYWTLDLFRQSDKQHVTGFFFFFPVWYNYNTIYRYTLVIYDEKDVVSDIDTGLLRSGGLYRLGNDYLSIDLHSGNYTYTDSYFWKEGGKLLLDIPNKNAYTHNLPTIIWNNEEWGDNPVSGDFSSSHKPTKRSEQNPE